MWQRKQTVFIICAVVAIAVCLALPIGRIEPPTLGADALLYNLGWMSEGATAVVGGPVWLLAVLMIIAGVVAVVDIFAFKKARMQKRLCACSMVLLFVWYVYYACLFFMLPANTLFHVNVAAALPLVALIFLWLARKGIQHDIDLVKSMDRIR